MKVLEQGRQQRGWATESTCTGNGNGGGGCGAKLLVEQADLYRTSHSSYDGSTDHFTTFRCCACGVETDLPEATVPGQIRRSIPTKRNHSSCQ